MDIKKILRLEDGTDLVIFIVALFALIVGVGLLFGLWSETAQDIAIAVLALGGIGYAAYRKIIQPLTKK